ncbi:hypothetical protein J6590_090929, partial [Homalodisca vitripennis]
SPPSAARTFEQGWYGPQFPYHWRQTPVECIRYAVCVRQVRSHLNVKDPHSTPHSGPVYIYEYVFEK